MGVFYFTNIASHRFILTPWQALSNIHFSMVTMQTLQNWRWVIPFDWVMGQWQRQLCNTTTTSISNRLYTINLPRVDIKPTKKRIGKKSRSTVPASIGTEATIKSQKSLEYTHCQLIYERQQRIWFGGNDDNCDIRPLVIDNRSTMSLTTMIEN